MVKKIELSQNLWALVDDEDYERVNQFIWSVSKINKRWYAVRGIVEEGKQKPQLLHRFIYGEENIPEGMLIDHKDGDGLDNRKENLRIATHSENLMNKVKKRHKNGMTSKYKGVHWDKRRERWIATVVVNKKQKYAGGFIDELEAAKAYDKASNLYHGEFANNNGLLS